MSPSVSNKVGARLGWALFRRRGSGVDVNGLPEYVELGASCTTRDLPTTAIPVEAIYRRLGDRVERRLRWGLAPGRPRVCWTFPDDPPPSFSSSRFRRRRAEDALGLSRNRTYTSVSSTNTGSPLSQRS